MAIMEDVRLRRFWLILCALFFSMAFTFCPSLLCPFIPEAGQAYADLIYKGVSLIRAVFLCGGLLCLACAWSGYPKFKFQDFGWQAKTVISASHSSSPVLLGAIAAIVLLSAGLRLPLLNSSFWWDELATQIMIVGRGPLIIMTYAARGTNHVLFSLLGYFSNAAFGQGEWQLRLPAFLLGSLTPLVAYRSLSRVVSPVAGISAAIMVTLHFSHIVHSTQSRGYAGAIFAIFWACSAFAAIGCERGIGKSARMSYLVASVLAFGFSYISILFLAGHGLLAGIAWLRCLVSKSRESLARLYFAKGLTVCWATIFALLAFGFPAPQVLEYALHGHDAASDHAPLSVFLLNEIASYVSGIDNVLTAWLLVILSAIGWLLGTKNNSFRSAFIAPVAVAVLWLLKPGGMYSSRFFFFIIPPFVVGIALLTNYLFERQKIVFAMFLVFLAVVVLLPTGRQYLHFVSVGNPDLKGLSEALSSKTVALAGQQADVNFYYFPNANQLHRDDFKRASEDVIIHGVKNEAIPDLQCFGPDYLYERTLNAWSDLSPAFQVYRRIHAE